MTQMGHFFLQFDADPLRRPFADAGQGGEPFDVAGDDRLADLSTRMPDKHRQGQFWADAGDGSQDKKQLFFLFFEKAEQGNGIFPDIGVDMEKDLPAFFRQPGNAVGRQNHLVADPADIDDRPVSIFRENSAG